MAFFGGFPFGDMGGMGGMGGGPSGPVDNERYYEVLGVNKDCTQGEIKKSFMKLARVKHPDKGGDPEEFKEIQEAYEVLKDPDMREKYDKYGEKALKESGGDGPSGGMDIFDLFGGGGRRRGGGRRKVAPTEF
jgi:DnaJ family protein A protein 2